MSCRWSVILALRRRQRLKTSLLPELVIYLPVLYKIKTPLHWQTVGYADRIAQFNGGYVSRARQRSTQEIKMAAMQTGSRCFIGSVPDSDIVSNAKCMSLGVECSRSQMDRARQLLSQNPRLQHFALSDVRHIAELCRLSCR